MTHRRSVGVDGRKIDVVGQVGEVGDPVAGGRGVAGVRDGVEIENIDARAPSMRSRPSPPSSRSLSPNPRSWSLPPRPNSSSFPLARRRIMVAADDVGVVVAEQDVVEA